MSQWKDRVVSHPIWQQMEALGPAIDRAQGREGIDQGSVQDLERLRTVLTFSGKRLAGADPDLLRVAPLDAIASSMQGIVQEVASFEADGQEARIVSANAYADSLLDQLASVHYPFVSDDVTAMRDASVAYRDVLERQIQSAQTSVTSISMSTGKLQEELSSLTAAVDVESSKLAAVGSEFQTKYAEAEAARTREFTEKVQAALVQLAAEAQTVQQKLGELTSEISTERGRLTALGAEFQAQFSTAQESRSRDFSDTQSVRQTTFSALMTDYTQRLTEQNAAFSKERETAFQQHQVDTAALTDRYGADASLILDQIRGHKQDVEKLVGVIGNLGVTSGYQKTANQAWWSMVVWQGIAVAAMLGVIVFAFRAFLPLTEGDFHWENFAGRVVLSIAVGVLAAYAASQGDKQLEIERRNRKLALELEAMGPYLAPLPTEKQEQFRLQIGERTFGRDEVGLGRRATEKSPATVIDVLMKSKEFREFIAEIVKAARG